MPLLTFSAVRNVILRYGIASPRKKEEKALMPFSVGYVVIEHVPFVCIVHFLKREEGKMRGKRGWYSIYMRKILNI